MPTNIPSVSGFADLLSLGVPGDPGLSLSQTAAYWLRRDIVRGVFEPMERLTVDRLVKFYGIGHSPIREAIILLSSSGLVIHEHQKGYRVAPVSLSDYDDVRDGYHRLYRLALDMALERGDQAWEEQLIVQLHRSSKVPKVLLDGDPLERERWQLAYGQFHAKLLSGCGSPLIMQLIHDIGGRLERYVNLFADLESDRNRDHHAEHRAIVDAVIARDLAHLNGLMDRYTATGNPVRSSIIEHLKQGDTGKRRKRKASVQTEKRIAAKRSERTPRPVRARART